MRARAAWILAGLAVLASSTACDNPFARQYEYDEQLYLSVDGSASVVVNSSLVALIALRGAPIDPESIDSVDRDTIRRLYESAGCNVTSVGRFWERRGRRFVQIQLTTDDVRTLPKCRLTSRSTYEFTRDGETLRFRQFVGATDGRNPGPVNWDGSEIVGFKLHLPSRIREHNVRRLDGTHGSPERGNILTWEQRLADRRAGVPLEMRVEMDATSILYTTVWLFAGAFGAAVLVMASLIWMAIRRGRRKKL